MTGNEENFVKNVVNSSIDVISSINEIHEDIDKAVKTLEECLKQENKIIIFGNKMAIHTTQNAPFFDPRTDS